MEPHDCEGFRVTFPGPFQHHDVVVDGWRAPFLHAQVHDGDSITLVLDNRFGLELTTAEADRIVPFVADAIAVALGYNAHPSADDVSLPDRSAHPRPRRVNTIARIAAGPAMELRDLEPLPKFEQTPLFTHEKVPTEELEREQGITGPQGLAALQDPEWVDDEASREYLSVVLDDAEHDQSPHHDRASEFR